MRWISLDWSLLFEVSEAAVKLCWSGTAQLLLWSDIEARGDAWEVISLQFLLVVFFLT